MEMEKEISKTGQRGGRTARNDVSFNNIPLPPASPPLPFINYPGDIGLAPYRLSELEIRMMMSRLRHSDMLTDLHHHQELIDRQYTVLSYMEETAKEAQALRQEQPRIKLLRLADLYPEDFSSNDYLYLESQLRNYIYNVQRDPQFSEVGDLGSLAQQMVKTGKNTVFPLVYRLIQLALVLPVATASVERVFSAMNIVKTDLRNKMGDEWMNDCLVVYIEKDIFATIENEQILQRFQRMKTRRMQLPPLRYSSATTTNTSNSGSVPGQENISLKMINAELTNRLSLLLRATSEYAASVELSGLGLGPGSDMSSVLHGLDKMSLGDGVNEDRRNRGDDVEGAGENTSQDTMVDTDLAEGSENDEVNRVSLPKSISVRSDRKLKTVQTGGSSEGQIYKQRVYVPGSEKEKQTVELEVYNQGMFKTELCNKWQETGECPYGENCQFAHGIKELRPVLRHPRYKTEVCRMVLSGDHCPYGHRCHFRHTLTDEEKLIRSMNIRPLKPLNR
ncbi:uncharacterized protein [Coffea arabica]|uniref:C3H1-type domain-containing protein n=1 Tax=Coffea arabica TaxID=13443 RepID=A0A6P6V8C4_COFAR